MRQRGKLAGIARFLTEAGELKRVRRSGWWSVGVNLPESVADHSFRSAMIAYILARMESADPYKALVMSLFSDVHEARLTDLHKLAQRYLNPKKAKTAAAREQFSLLPRALQEELSRLYDERGKQASPEARIAHDADILELILQAREYQRFGFTQAKSFARRGSRLLKTKSSKALLKPIASATLGILLILFAGGCALSPVQITPRQRAIERETSLAQKDEEIELLKAQLKEKEAELAAAQAKIGALRKKLESFGSFE